MSFLFSRGEAQRDQVLAIEQQRRETQTQTRALALDSLQMGLTMVESHLNNILAGADARKLDLSASTMVTCLNMLRVSFEDMKGDGQGQEAARSVVIEFSNRILSHLDADHPAAAKIQAVTNAVAGHLLTVASDDIGRVPQMEIHALDENDPRRADPQIAQAAMGCVTLGHHKTADLKEKVNENEAAVDEAIAQKAASGRQLMEEYRGPVSFDDGMKSILQSDMTRLTPIPDPRRLKAEAKRTLQRGIEADSVPDSAICDHDDFPTEILSGEPMDEDEPQQEEDEATGMNMGRDDFGHGNGGTPRERDHDDGRGRGRRGSRKYQA